MKALRVITGVIMLVGLAWGANECSQIMDRAQSAIHEVYAVATAAAYFIAAYILARAIENIGSYFYWRRRARSDKAKQDGDLP